MRSSRIGLSGSEGKAKLVLPVPIKPWVGLELLDEAGHPWAGEPYRIELPDGSALEGTLDEEGRARIESEIHGTCRVTFPEIDGGDWELSTYEETPPPAWLGLALVDDMGAPIAGEAYRVRLPDGSEVEGELDADGRARIESPVAGVCRVTFPNIDAGEWLTAATNERALAMEG